MSAKIIINKYAAVCAKTGSPIPAGIPAFWAKGYGVWTVASGDTLPPPKAAPGAASFDPAPLLAALAALQKRVEDLEYAVSTQG